MSNRYRIVEVKDGFKTDYYVQRKIRWFFWLLTGWVNEENPNHKYRDGKEFPSKEDAEEHLRKLLIERTVKIVS